MPAVKKMGERLFKDFYDDESNEKNQLLSTIRVPKNLLYLTDRLPKPSYDGSTQPRAFMKKGESTEKRKLTDDDETKMPDIKPKHSGRQASKPRGDKEQKHQREQSLPVLQEQVHDIDARNSEGENSQRPSIRGEKNSNQMQRNKIKKESLH